MLRPARVRLLFLVLKPRLRVKKWTACFPWWSLGLWVVRATTGGPGNSAAAMRPSIRTTRRRPGPGQAAFCPFGLGGVCLAGWLVLEDTPQSPFHWKHPHLGQTHSSNSLPSFPKVRRKKASREGQDSPRTGTPAGRTSPCCHPK